MEGVMAEYFDDLETRSPEARERAQFATLPYQIGFAKDNAPFYRDLLQDIDPAAVSDRITFARLPLTRKSDLIGIQRQRPPFGGLVTQQPGQLVRIFQSPGPIYDVEGHERDYWRTARAFFAAGVRPGDIIHNAFAYHLTPAGAMVEGAARRLGCAVFPAGTGNTEHQVRAIADIRPRAYAGTPSFLKLLLERSEEYEADISSLVLAVVAGEALPQSLRAELEAFGIAARQWYATADAGLIAYESESGEGLIVDEGVIVEIVRPGTGDPVADGEVGEVVVTVLTSQEYPLIRFATGDLSAVLPGRSPCGRTGLRLKGWLGRADQTTKVKGMFVHPQQVAEVVKRHPEIKKARLVISRDDRGQDIMTLVCETTGLAAGDVASTLQSVCKVKGLVEAAAPGTLANDGKIIDDRRPAP
jgi:phenylacetate-CoA ligase